MNTSSVDEFVWKIPSDTAAGQKVQAAIIALLEERNYSDRDIFGMRLALEEGIVNAIKHGNKLADDKSVHVKCEINSEKVRVVIEDEGEGFAPAEVPDPTADENLEKPCGRGIMLMRAFMSLIEYTDNGRCLVLEKERTVESAQQD